MRIAGYAYTAEEQKIAIDRRERYQQLKKINGVDWKNEVMYSKYAFSGTLTTPEAQELSEEDLAILVDGGSVCFGGNCTKSQDKTKFFGMVYTD